MINRRDIFKFGIGSVSLTTANAVHAFQFCGPSNDDLGPIYRGEFLSGLNKTIWVPIGPQDRSATAYAIVAPWCPFCRQLTRDAVRGSLRFNLRVIPGEARNISDQIRIFNLSAKKDRLSIDQFHERSSIKDYHIEDPQLFRFLIRIQQRVIWSFQEWKFAILPHTFSGFPTIAVPLSGGDIDVELVSGYNDAIKRQIERIIAPFSFDNKPLGLSVVRAIASFERKDVWARPVVDSPRIWTIPVRGALASECLRASSEYRFQGTLSYDQNRWFVGTGNGDTVMFARQGEFVES